MAKPLILVTSAASTTGLPVSLQMLEQGFPVRAFVRRKDERSAKLARAGAEVFVGDLGDPSSVSLALENVGRAYFCSPWSPQMLNYGVIFAQAAQEAHLEAIVVMSQWLADPNHPSVATRAHWLTDKLMALLPDVAVITVNPGFFADNYMLLLEPISQLGLLPLPLGEGLNAPPSNEDVARVVTGLLVDPLPHRGRTYRPTGPALLSPLDIAAIFAKVLGRKVTYFPHVPEWMLIKAMKVYGLDSFTQAQVRYYVKDYAKNAFGVGAPTDVVLTIGGKAAEDFETITRRYVSEQKPGNALGKWLGAAAHFTMTPFTPVVNLGRLERNWGTSVPGTLSMDTDRWRQAHGLL